MVWSTHTDKGVTMRTIRATILGGLILLATAAPTGAALAASGTAAEEPRARLTLTVAGGTPSITQVVELTCDPDGGTHPNPADACAALRDVAGDASLLRMPEDTMCPGIFDPHTVLLSGVWEGRTISYKGTFANKCLLQATTGALFAL
jgi:hypothetical protein